MASTTTVQRQQVAVTRSDHLIPGEPGIELSVREVASLDTAGQPILLVHGGGPGGLASFDLPVAGYSVAEDLARAGHPVYVLDVRGWGGSTRPAALDQPVQANPPAVSSEEAVRDISATVDWIVARAGARQVALVGWASGGHWCGMYTSRHNDRVSHLVMLNSLYCVAAPWRLLGAFEDPDRPGELSRNLGAYRILSADALLKSWDAAIPDDDTASWRDPEVGTAFQRAALASDPTSETRDPASMRAPSGFQHDSYLMARGMKLWGARAITVPTLVLRGALDHWSRPEDRIALQRELVNSPMVRTRTIPDGTHYLFLDRPSRGRATFLQEVVSFLE